MFEIEQKQIIIIKIRGNSEISDEALENVTKGQWPNLLDIALGITVFIKKAIA